MKFQCSQTSSYVSPFLGEQSPLVILDSGLQSYTQTQRTSEKGQTRKYSSRKSEKSKCYEISATAVNDMIKTIMDTQVKLRNSSLISSDEWISWKPSLEEFFGDIVKQHAWLAQRMENIHTLYQKHQTQNTGALESPKFVKLSQEVTDLKNQLTFEKQRHDNVN